MKRSKHSFKEGIFRRRVFGILIALAMVITLVPMNAMQVKADDTAVVTAQEFTITHNNDDTYTVTGVTVADGYKLYAAAPSKDAVDRFGGNSEAYSNLLNTFEEMIKAAPSVGDVVINPEFFNVVEISCDTPFKFKEGSVPETGILISVAKENLRDGEYEYIALTIGMTTNPAKGDSTHNKLGEPTPIEYTITATAGANGSITPSGAVKAAEGDDKRFTITPNEGYEIDTLQVDGKQVEASTSYTFSKVEKDHTIDVTFKEKSVTPEPTPTPTPTPDPDPTPTPDPDPTPTPGDTDKENIANDTKPSDNAFNTNLSETPSELKDKVLTDEERAKVANGESGSIYLEVTDVSASVSDTDKTFVESVKGESTIGMYIDISLYVKVGTSEPRKVTNTNGTVTITVQLPETLINTNSAVSRDYQIIRVHDGVSSVIPCTYDAAANTISFETDAFSTYALAYKDTINNNQNENADGDTNGSTNNGTTNTAEITATTDKKDSVPKTGDSTPIGWLFAVALLSGAGVMITGKKKKQNS